MAEVKTKDEKSEEPVHIVYDFKCSMCGMDEKAQYKGTKPQFSRNIILKHASYVMKDPFSPPGKGEILVLGADCAVCENPICISKECSLFYNKTYCLECAHKCLETFPAEIKTKLASVKKK